MEKKQALAALGALAQETRLDIFRLLVECGPAGLSAGRIAARLGLAPATLSFHLKELRQAGLAQARRDGRSLVYAADFERMGDFLRYLTESCCGGTPQLCVPAALLPQDDGSSRRRRA
jgi:DNA-binding transcriptional ArsR family regulator